MSEKTLKRPEVLAPAGTLEKLKVAVDYGADAVFVGGPRRAVETQEGSPCTLFAAKAEAAVEQTIDKPFETYRDFYQFTAQVVDHTVDHRR